MGRPNLLVVDDDGDQRTLLAELLREEGYAVVEAGDGRTALNVLASLEAPCIALVDLLMPGMDGAELCVALHTDPRLQHVAVIAMSGTHGHVPPFARMLLEKPFGFDDLLAALAACL